MHMVADMSRYTGIALDSDTVSICHLHIFGTKYVRDETLPSSVTLRQGETLTIPVPNLYSSFLIGNEIAIQLRQKTELSFVSFAVNASSSDLIIDAIELPPGVYSLTFESYDTNSNVKSALKTDTIEIIVEEKDLILPFISDL